MLKKHNQIWGQWESDKSIEAFVREKDIKNWLEENFAEKIESYIWKDTTEDIFFFLWFYLEEVNFD